MTPAFVNAVFAEVSSAIADFIHREDRTTLQASLFNVPKRTELGAYCYGEHIGAFIDALTELASAETLGTVMRAPARRPNSLHVVGIPWLYLFDRERRLLNREPERPSGERDRVLEYCGRALSTFRGDGHCVPHAPLWDMSILDTQDIAALANIAEECDVDRKRELRRLAATLELYCFVLHGEHRDGIFHHGPYDIGQGEQMVVKDFTDLQNDFLPWSGELTRLPVQAVSVIYVLPRKAHCRIDLWGTAHFEDDPYEQILRAVVVSYAEDGKPYPMPLEEWSALARAAQMAQKHIFVTVAQWPVDERTRYGARLFANHLREIPRVLQLPLTIEADLLSRFDESAEAFLRKDDGANLSPVWTALRRKCPFTPIEREAGHLVAEGGDQL
jgi:hypothetical protein